MIVLRFTWRDVPAMLLFYAGDACEYVARAATAAAEWFDRRAMRRW